MFDPLIYLLYIVAGFAAFFGIVPLAVAIIRGDQRRIDQILDLYIEVFRASAEAVIGALRIFRRKEGLPVPPTSTPSLPPPETKQITQQKLAGQ